MSVSTIKDQDGKQYMIFDESELYDDSIMGDKLEDFAITYDYGTNQFLRLLTDTDRQLMRTLTLEFGGCE